ncbi:MAG: bifunctional ornithine acetyltransferase/N-acetylglutamate synthase, partial [Thermoleophilaceae bacterium]
MSFFRSRWVDRPAHVEEIDPTALPQGFRAAGVAAGLKPDGLDVGVLVSDEPETVSAARFTTNGRLGAPVIVSRQSATDGLRVVVANSGGSNTGDGERGIETARATQRAAAQLLDVEPAQVGVASTGVIGTELPCDKLVAGVRDAVAQLGPDAGALAEAIMTTDRTPKRACLTVNLPSGGAVRLAAQAKGAGMISPRFATMFCFVETDAQLDQATLDLLTGVCVKRSFDRISVDGQLSTSDTVFALANGASGVRVEAESPDELALGEAMDALMRQLAIEIVADGEGAGRIGRVVVQGASADVERVARAVADSPLVKTALHGGDPNFGRIVQAAGAAFASDGYAETFPV